MSLGGKGAVMQVRGDWSWLKQTFNFPSWSNKQICWRCKANSDEFDWRDTLRPTPAGVPSGSRRSSSSSSGASKASTSNPIFELTHFKLDYVTIDALHALYFRVQPRRRGQRGLGVHRVCRKKKATWTWRSSTCGRSCRNTTQR